MNRILTPLLLSLCALLLSNGCGPTVVGGDGGTITETVGVLGTLVDTLGAPVPGAAVTVHSPTHTAQISTDSYGDYLFGELEPGIYTLSAVYGDSDLVAFIGPVEATFVTYATYKDDTRTWVLPAGEGSKRQPIRTIRLDTLFAPGSLSGTAQLESGPVFNLLVNIPGTSYGAWTNADGSFRITGIAPGNYTLLYTYSGHLPHQSGPVVVFSNTNTSAPPVTLTLDPAGPPPAPTTLTAIYDTLLATVSLSWDSVRVPDLNGYRVYLDPGDGVAVTVAALVKAQTFTDTVYWQSDTLPRNYRYLVAALDTNGNLSTHASSALTVVCPQRVRSTATWTLHPEPLTPAQPTTVIVELANSGRDLASIDWFLAGASQSTRHSVLAGRTAWDTLSLVAPDSGTLYIRIEITTSAGSKDSDSIAVPILAGLRPRDTWVATGALPQSRREIELVTASGSVYGVGGFNTIAGGRAAATGVFCFSPADSSWTSCAQLDSGRYSFAATTLDSALFLIGGLGNQGTLFRSIVRLDLATGQSSVAAQLPRPRFGAGACALDGFIYITGGVELDRRGNFVCLNRIDRFDPASGAIDSVGALLDKRQSHRTVALNGQIYSLGGIGDYFLSGNCLSSCERFDPRSALSSPLPQLESARAYFAAAVIDSTIMVAGGIDSGNNAPLSSVEKFSLGQPFSWSPCAALPSARHSVGGAAWDNTLLIGGGSIGSIESGAEVSLTGRYYP